MSSCLALLHLTIRQLSTESVRYEREPAEPGNIHTFNGTLLATVEEFTLSSPFQLPCVCYSSFTFRPTFSSLSHSVSKNAVTVRRWGHKVQEQLERMSLVITAPEVDPSVKVLHWVHPSLSQLDITAARAYCIKLSLGRRCDSFQTQQ